MESTNPTNHVEDHHPFRCLEGFEDIEANELGEVRWVRSKKKLKAYSSSAFGGFTSYYFKYYPDMSAKNQKCVSAFNLIARIFVPNPKNYKHVQTIDGNNANYRASNLEWVHIRRRRPTPDEEDR